MPSDVFISYSTLDGRVATAVKDKLECTGFTCFFAPRDIPGGDEWIGALVESLRNCKVVVLIFSAASIVSPWVIRELINAIHNGVSIINFRLEQVVPTKEFSFLLSPTQWLDAVPPPVEDHLDRLVQAVAKLICNDQSSNDKPPSAAVPAESLPEDVLQELLTMDAVRTIWGDLIEQDPDLVRREINEQWRYLRDGRASSSRPINESKFQTKERAMTKFQELLQIDTELIKTKFIDVVELTTHLKKRAVLATAIQNAFIAGELTQREHDDLTVANRLHSLGNKVNESLNEMLSSLIDLPSVRMAYGDQIERDPRAVIARWELEFKQRTS